MLRAFRIFLLALVPVGQLEAKQNSAYYEMQTSIRILYSEVAKPSDLPQAYVNYLNIIKSYNLAVSKGLSRYYVFPISYEHFGSFLKNHKGKSEEYFTPQEQRDFKLSIENGVLKLNGETLDTSDGTILINGDVANLLMTQVKDPLMKTGKAIFVMDGEGQVFIFKHPEHDLIHHSSLLAGMPVAAAGELRVIDGHFVVESNQKNLSDQSGHYPLPPSALNQFTQNLTLRGTSTKDMNIENIGSYLDPGSFLNAKKIRLLRAAGIPSSLIIGPGWGVPDRLVDVMAVDGGLYGESERSAILNALNDPTASEKTFTYVLLNDFDFNYQNFALYSLESNKKIYQILNKHFGGADKTDQSDFAFRVRSKFDFLSILFEPSAAVVSKSFAQMKSQSNGRRLESSIKLMESVFFAMLNSADLRIKDNREALTSIFKNFIEIEQTYPSFPYEQRTVFWERLDKLKDQLRYLVQERSPREAHLRQNLEILGYQLQQMERPANQPFGTLWDYIPNSRRLSGTNVENLVKPPSTHTSCISNI